MIYEVILTTRSPEGIPHLAPMGVHVMADGTYHVMPFRPSKTLDHLLHQGVAVMNVSDDVRVFAGCLTGRRDWPLCPATRVNGDRLVDALSHLELEVLRVEDDLVRPRFVCQVVHTESHRPFRGFNRAQAAVIEAAILVSRWNRLPASTIREALALHETAIQKTAGPREREGWAWLCGFLDQHLGESS